MKWLLCIVVVLSMFLNGCSSYYKTITYNELPKNTDSLEIHEGILCQTARRIKYMSEGELKAVIDISEPVMVAIADQEEEWGFFQFPNIGKAEDGTLVVSWQMKADSPKEYGKTSNRKYIPMMSKDDGKTWSPRDRKYDLKRNANYVRLRDNSVMSSSTSIPKEIDSYKEKPNAVAKKKRYDYYVVDELPEDLQGAYITYNDESGTELIHAKLYDPGLLRWSYDGLMSVVWKGHFKQLSDESIVAGVYPTYYLDSKGDVSPGGVSFYQSFDKGRSWEVIGKIPFVEDGFSNRRGDKSFDEPCFEILADSSFLCVMRSGSTSPLYRTFSFDRGHTWTKPEPFTPNGVKPCLMTLENGVVVLSSGRPGVQVRFNLDGKGYSWTDPIEMIPFMEMGWSSNRDISCGYTSMIGADGNSFYLVYSNFTTKDRSGNTRKSIWCRKLTVNK